MMAAPTDTNRVITVTRGGHTFHVLDSPQTASWNFWDLFIAQWEPTTLAAIDAHLPPSGLLWDIGAWVGPVSLWAAVTKSARVLALEPDPVAYLQLLENVRRNGLSGQQPLITPMQAALSNEDGDIPFYATDGNTRGSLTAENGPGHSISVIGCSPPSLLSRLGRPDLIKMDIEGGESLILPQFGPLFRRLNIPMILSLHPDLYAADTVEALEEELTHWYAADLGNHAYYCTVRDAA